MPYINEVILVRSDAIKTSSLVFEDPFLDPIMSFNKKLRESVSSSHFFPSLSSIQVDLLFSIERVHVCDQQAHIRPLDRPGQLQHELAKTRGLRDHVQSGGLDCSLHSTRLL